MKKKYFMLISLISAIGVAVCSGCSDSATIYEYEDSTYLIEAVGYEEKHQETLTLNNITYNNSFITGDISGVLCIPQTEYERSYTIENQTITFKQLYGDIWQASVSVAEHDNPVVIYASRKGKNATGESLNIDCGGRKTTAYVMESYSHIKYLFYGDINYLEL